MIAVSYGKSMFNYTKTAELASQVVIAFEFLYKHMCSIVSTCQGGLFVFSIWIDT